MRKNGFALALTLWIVAMMSLVTVLYLSYGKKVVFNSSQLHKKLDLIFEAESTVELLKFYGSTGSFKSISINNEFVKKSFPLFPKRILLDSTEIVWKNSTIVLQDTAGLVDINDIEGVANLINYELRASKDKKSIIKDSILDWLDKDRIRKLNGAETPFYQKYGYVSSDRDYFIAREELFLIKGIKNLRYDVREKILSSLVLTDNNRRNILTFSNQLLQLIYNLSENDIQELEKLKKEYALAKFSEFFFSINKENYDFEIDGGIPSHIIRATVLSSVENIKKKIVVLIDFRETNQAAFEVLRYKD